MPIVKQGTSFSHFLFTKHKQRKTLDVQNKTLQRKFVKVGLTHEEMMSKHIIKKISLSSKTTKSNTGIDFTIR